MTFRCISANIADTKPWDYPNVYFFFSFFFSLTGSIAGTVVSVQENRSIGPGIRGMLLPFMMNAAGEAVYVSDKMILSTNSACSGQVFRLHISSVYAFTGTKADTMLSWCPTHVS